MFIFYFENIYSKNTSLKNNWLSNINTSKKWLGIKFPFFISLLILFFGYTVQFHTKFTIGIDFGTQLKAVLLWQEGYTSSLNNSLNYDLATHTTHESWLFRPPGAILYYVPFLQLPLPLGESLRVAELLLCIFICYSWLKIAEILDYDKKIQCILSVILSIWLATHLSFTGNVQLVVTAYSSILLLIVIKFLLKLKYKGFYDLRDHLILSLNCFFLGSTILIKASSIVFNASIIFMIYLFIIVKRYWNIYIGLSLFFSTFIFCIPYFILTTVNSLYGVELNDVYSQDYNNQWLTQEQWGNFFTETTNFPAICFSFTACLSTFSPFQLSQELLSNLLTYIGIWDDFILSFHLNPRVLYKATIGTFFSILFGYCFLKYFSPSRKISYILATTLLFPFVIFTYLTNKHGFNYIITSAYSEQFIPLFCLLILIVSFNLLKKKNIKSLLFAFAIIFFSVGLYTYSNTCYLFQIFKNRFETKSIMSSHIGHHFFGNNPKKIDDKIIKYRKSFDIPIIYIGNSSIDEMSIAYKGIYSGIGNVTEMLKNKNYMLPAFENEVIIILDATLEDHDLHKLCTMISKRNYIYLLNLTETAKVIHITG